MDINKANKYAKTSLRISYLNIILAVLGLLGGGIGVISLIACLGAFSYANLAVKNNSTETKKIKRAKVISIVIAVVLLGVIAFRFFA